MQGLDSTGNHYLATKIYESQPSDAVPNPPLKELCVFKGENGDSRVVVDISSILPAV